MKNHVGTRNTTIVMDVLPWPDGCGFSGGDEWWQHTLSQSERDRLDNLLGIALLDHDVCEQLVSKRDPSLFGAFDFSEETRRWLSTVKASTLKEFAQAIVAASTPFRKETSPEAA